MQLIKRYPFVNQPGIFRTSTLFRADSDRQCGDKWISNETHTSRDDAINGINVDLIVTLIAKRFFQFAKLIPNSFVEFSPFGFLRRSFLNGRISQSDAAKNYMTVYFCFLNQVTKYLRNRSIWKALTFLTHLFYLVTL